MTHITAITTGQDGRLCRERAYLKNPDARFIKEVRDETVQAPAKAAVRLALPDFSPSRWRENAAE